MVEVTQNVPIVNHMQQYGLKKWDTRTFNRTTTNMIDRRTSKATHSSKKHASNFLRVFKGESAAEVVKECGICFEPFNESDEIVECILIHVFHAKCFEENKDGPKDEKCPSCQKAMKLKNRGQSVALPALAKT